MTRNQFRKWLEERLADVEPTIARLPAENAAQVIFEAKANAYGLQLYDMAKQLPERDSMTPLDCCLRLRDCLEYLDRPPLSECSRDVLIGLEEAARILGYKAAGLRKIVRQKRIKYVQQGQGRIKFRREWLDEYIEANASGPQDVKRSPAQKRVARITIEPRLGFDPSLYLK